MPPLQLNPAFLMDSSLYCCEENWEEEEVRSDSYCFSNNNNPNPFPELLEQDLYWEDEELSTLLSKQESNQLCSKLQVNPSLVRVRREAVEWILKVNAHYSFTCLTAVLAVNYLDRFLFSFQFQREKPWMTQLVAVACLSLAAKVEETQVPLLLDLQVEDSRYVFEAKTIQKMEILVLSTLLWKMNPVTPLSFLDFMTRRLALKDYLCWEFLQRCEHILLSVVSDSRFMHYLPSVVATATLLHVIKSLEPCLEVEYEKQLLGMLGIDKGKVENCRKLIMELAVGVVVVVHDKQSNKRKLVSIQPLPGSPNGVMDVSFSSDSSNDSWAVAPSVSSSPEPLSKKTRAAQQDQLLTIPR